MHPSVRYAVAELTDLLGLLREIPDEEWNSPTACEGFRVRDVVSHLVLSREGLPRRAIGPLVRGGRAFTDMGGRLSREAGDQRTPDELRTNLERVIARPRAGVLGKLIPADNMLADHATHVQDVRVGLDRRSAPDRERAGAVLDAALGMTKPITWGVRERAEGLRLEADDVDWTHGSGPEVRGPYDAMLLALGGRSAGLTHLTGDGVDVLAPRVALAL
jgi:uncharacterized protein (TIGR03083 family)